MVNFDTFCLARKAPGGGGQETWNSQFMSPPCSKDASYQIWEEIKERISSSNVNRHYISSLAPP
jgi:hypothetical protein